MTDELSKALERSRAANEKVAGAIASAADAVAGAKAARAENQRLIDGLRAERERMNTGRVRGDWKAAKRIKELSAQIRELEGAPRAFSRRPGERTAMRVTPAGAKTGG